MKIVITDSGLGGLSVVADFEKRLSENPYYKKVEVIYFNSLHSSEYGYNLMPSITEKARVFNNALNSIEQSYEPDVILIACNTLSVVYPYTDFSKTSKTRVNGIVESGIELFENNLKSRDTNLLLFGTETTMDSNVYKKALVKRGVEESHIVNQACYELETKIQNNPNSIITRKEIAKFVKIATEKIEKNKEKTYAGFCCTHYGYSEAIFQHELTKQLKGKVEVLNPNSKMLDFLFANRVAIGEKCNVTIKVVSQVKLKRDEINSLSNIFNDKSPKTAFALKNYEFVANLFKK